MRTTKGRKKDLLDTANQTDALDSGEQICNVERTWVVEGTRKD